MLKMRIEDNNKDMEDTIRVYTDAKDEEISSRSVGRI